MRMLVALLLVAEVAHAQETEAPTEYCAFDGSPVTFPVATRDPDPSADSIWKNVLKRLGLYNAKFDFRAADVKGAVAFWGDKGRSVYYDPVLFKAISAESNDWASSGILAHELAHHQLGHTHSVDKPRIQLERDADDAAGFALFQMHATEEDAGAAPRSLKNPLGSDNYDPRDERVNAFKEGWRKARIFRLYGLKPALDRPVMRLAQKKFDVTKRWEEPPDTQDPAPVSRVVIERLSSTNYLLSNHTVVSIAADGKAEIIGRQVPAYFPGYAWMLQSSTGLYGVTTEGEVVRPKADGRLVNEGYITQR